MKDSIQILLVEDNPVDARLIQEQLKHSPLQSSGLHHASDLSSALVLLQKKPIDVVLLDLGLPDNQGLGAIEKIIALRPSLPVLVLTGTKDAQIAIRALQLGAQDYLIKGEINTSALVRVIRYSCERKQVEAELHKSRKLLYEAERISHTGAWEWEIGTDKWSVSDEWMRIHGVCNSHLSTEEMTALAHPDDLPAIQTVWKKMFDEKGEYNIQHRVIKQDSGEERIIHAFGRLLKSPDGNPEKLLGVARDITEQKLAEEAVTLSRARSHMLVESMTSAVTIYQPIDNGKDFVISEFNAAAEKIEKLKREEVIGKRVTKVFPGIEDFGLLNVLRKAHRTGQPQIHPPSLYKDERISSWRENHVVMLPNGEIAAIYEDITKRKQAEDKIRFQAHLLETVEQAVIVTHLDGQIIYWNPFAEKLYGWSSEEAIGRNIAEVTVPQMSQNQAAEIMAQLGAGQGWSGEFYAQHRDGHTFPAFVSDTPIRNEQGELFAIIGISMDITKRRKAEEALRRNEADLKKAQQVANLGSWTWHIPTNKLHWSDQMYKIFDIKKFKFSGSLPDIMISRIHPEDLPAVEASNKSVIENGTPIPLEYRVICQDGTERTVWAEAGELTFDEEGKPLILTGIVQDITERKQAENALKESEKKYKNLVETASDAIYMMAEDGTIIDTNQCACDMLGKTKDEIIGSMIDTVDPNFPVEAFLEFWKGVPYDKQNIFETTHQHKNGHLIPIEISGKKYQLNGKTYYYGIARDITERKRSENALRRSEASLKKAQQVANVGSWTWHIPTDKLEWSDQMFEIYHIDKQDFNPVWSEIISMRVHPDDFSIIQTADQSLNKDHTPISIEYRVVRPDGTERIVWAEAGDLTLDEEGNPLTLTGILQDITERKQAENDLRRAKEEAEDSERKLSDSLVDLQLAQKIASIGNWQLDPALGTPIWSDEIYTIYERDRELGPPHIDEYKQMYGEDQYKIFNEAIGRAISLGEDYDIILKFISPNNNEKWVRAICKPDRSQKGAKGYILRGTIQDITEQKKVEEALRHSETRLHKAQEIANLGNWIWHMPTNELIWSSQLYKIFGVSKENFKGDLFELINKTAHPDDIERINRIHQSIAETGNPIPYEVRIFWPDGTERTLYSEAGECIRDEQGHPQIITGITQDITERKQMELALQEERNLLAQRVEERTAELQRANTEMLKALQTKDEFLANMSHELRTPLTAILGLAEILEMGVRGPLNEQQIHSIRMIYESGEHLLTLINDILDLSKVEAGKLEIETGTVIVDDICAASLSLVKGMAHAKNLTLDYDLPDKNISMIADARRLKQILVNLLSNAVKFTEEGGDVSLEVVPNQEEHKLQFIVEDSGIGISREDMEKIFQPFTQLDSSLSRQYEGTGLGLALASRLVKMHHGTVSVESSGVPGEGSRFTVTLPWHDAASPENPSLEHPSAVYLDEKQGSGENNHSNSGKGDLILLAEDSPANTTTISDYLKTKGFRVENAENGEEAIQKTQSLLPDLILMDIQMPVMDGLTAIQQLRKDERFAHTPIVALTALAMPDDEQRCLDAGASDYISKPVKLKDLHQKIQDILKTT